MKTSAPELLVADLLDMLEDLQAKAAEAHRVAPNSYGDGYCAGFSDAFTQILRGISGEPS
jgi:hypothetical protein